MVNSKSWSLMKQSTEELQEKLESHEAVYHRLMKQSMEEFQKDLESYEIVYYQMREELLNEFEELRGQRVETSERARKIHDILTPELCVEIVKKDLAFVAKKFSNVEWRGNYIQVWPAPCTHRFLFDKIVICFSINRKWSKTEVFERVYDAEELEERLEKMGFEIKK